MPKFLYKSKNIKGEIVEGIVEANDRLAAQEMIRKEKEFIVSLREIQKNTKINPFGFLNRIGLKDKLIFVQHLAVMVRSGFSIVRALDSISNQTQNHKLIETLKSVKKDVEDGNSLSSALSTHPNLLPQIYVQIIASGEKSGKLEKVLLQISKDLEKNFDLIARVRSALVYPLFILFTMIVVVIIVMLTAVPQLKSMFEDMGVKLPLATRLLIGFTDLFINYWWIVFIASIIFIIAIIYIGKRPGGRLFFDRVKLKVPIFGLLLRQIYCARFVRTLNILIAAGLPIVDIFKTMKETIGNVVFEIELEDARAKIENGVPISNALKESKIFPSIIPELIAVGEQSGNLEFVLTNLTRFFERDVNYMTRNLSSMIEPILMVLMGVGVAFVVIAVIMPIYGLVNVIK